MYHLQAVEWKREVPELCWNSVLENLPQNADHYISIYIPLLSGT
ncbi:MAG: hypothetical protein V4732_22420 [Pseudomonadota bacterium]